MKAYDKNGLRLRVGDDVVCVKPSKLEHSEGLPHCIVGSMHKIDDVIKSEKYDDILIQLDCHPYQCDYFEATSSDPHRFIKVIK